ncbi:MAG: hypothetical protein CMO55_05690 [Verrucomicrobiales bacterium]|nr:hypothetical protein [Verrucomicrobiales bacterium]
MKDVFIWRGLSFKGGFERNASRFYLINHMGDNPINPVIRSATFEGDGGMAVSESVGYHDAMEGQHKDSGDDSAVVEGVAQKAMRIVLRSRAMVIFLLLFLFIATAFLIGRSILLQTTGSLILAVSTGLPFVFLFVSLLNALRSHSRFIDGVPLREEERQKIADIAEASSSRIRPETAADSFDELLGEPTANLDRITVVPEFNAAVVQIPRWSILGGYRNQMVFGLPFLQAVSLPEFRASLSQEIFLFFGGGDANAAWVWRTRDTWERFLNRIAKSKSLGSLVLRVLVGSAGERLLDILNPACRELVFKADQFAVSVENDEQVASALARIEVVALQYDKAWETFSASEVPTESGSSACDHFAEVMRESYSEFDAQTWLGKSLLRRSDSSDPFPSLVERLEGIDSAPGIPVVEAAERGEFSILPAIPPVPSDRAAVTQLFSGEQVRKISDSFRPEWFDLSDAHWKLQHPAVKQARGVTQ